MKLFIFVYYLCHYLSIWFSYFLRKVYCFSKKWGNTSFHLYFWNRAQSKSPVPANNSPLFLCMCAFPSTVPSVRLGKLLGCPVNYVNELVKVQNSSTFLWAILSPDEFPALARHRAAWRVLPPRQRTCWGWVVRGGRALSPREAPSTVFWFWKFTLSCPSYSPACASTGGIKQLST